MKQLKTPKVELAGFEPASKQAAYVLSTCVVGHWFSTAARGQTR